MLDNHQPQKILSFHSFDGVSGKPDTPVEVILVVDTIKMPVNLAAEEREEVEKFLRQNSGYLAQPTATFGLSDDVLSSALQSLLRLRLADHDQRCSALSKRVPDHFHIGTRQSSLKMRRQGSRTCANHGVKQKERRKEQSDQRPYSHASHVPCWVGFSVLMIFTLPAASLLMTAAWHAPITPAECSRFTAS